MKNVDVLYEYLNRGQYDAECKVFPWGKQTAGYVCVWLDGKTVGAHKLALEHKLGRPLTHKEVTRHMCHNPACVNPNHLEVGGTKENMQDCIQAGRFYVVKGEKHHSAKVSDASIELMKKMRKEGYKVKEVAEYFSCSQALVSMLVNNKHRATT